MADSNVTHIMKHYLEKAANLDMGWQFSANGDVSIHVVGEPDKRSLLNNIANRSSGFLFLHQVGPYDYAASGELKSRIKQNLVQSEEKKAKKEGFASLMDKAAQKLDWAKDDNGYSVAINYLNTPEWKKNILNALVMDNSIIRRIDVSDKLSHKGYAAYNSYHNHYIANENLTKLIEQDIENKNKKEELKRQEAYESGEKLLARISGRGQVPTSDKAAKIITMRNKETRQIILR